MDLTIFKRGPSREPVLWCRNAVVASRDDHSNKLLAGIADANTLRRLGGKALEW